MGTVEKNKNHMTCFRASRFVMRGQISNLNRHESLCPSSTTSRRAYQSTEWTFQSMVLRSMKKRRLWPVGCHQKSERHAGYSFILSANLQWSFSSRSSWTGNSYNVFLIVSLPVFDLMANILATWVERKTHASLFLILLCLLPLQQNKPSFSLHLTLRVS